WSSDVCSSDLTSGCRIGRPSALQHSRLDNLSMARMKALSEFDFKGKTVLLRVDINSPINAEKRIANENRIRESVPTLKKLLDAGDRKSVVAHQGDTLDYQNLIPMKEHAE